MVVFVFLMIVLRCFVLVSSDDCDKSHNENLSLDNDDFRDFYKFYKMIKQSKKQDTSITTNNIYIVPIPYLSSHTNDKSSHEETETVFRDIDATHLNKDYKKKTPQVMRKFMSDDSDKPLNPRTHKNWNLLPKMCGLSAVGDRITGGEDASLGQYPWMVRLGFVNKEQNNSAPIFRCGGSIISRKHIITAAHCVTNLPSELSVGVIRLGEYNTETTIDCVYDRCAEKVIDVKPKEIIVHEEYGNPNARHDIAIIKIQNSIAFTEWISPICLPFDDLMASDYTNQRGEVAGWGFYDISVNRGSTILKTVQLPILKSKPCSKAFRGVVINDNMQLCVGGDLGKDSCNGDSGGPLMKVVPVNNEPKYVLLGIVSLGAKYCGLTTTPAIYTKITYYMEWLLDHM